MTQARDWRRVSRREPCPACGRPDWCMVTGPVGDPTAAICPRVVSGRRAGAGGYLHLLRRDGEYRSRRRTVRVPTLLGRDVSSIDFTALATECHAAADPAALAGLADGLGVSVDALRRLRVGWSAHHVAWTWPMCDGTGRIVGIRLRGANGRKWSVRGGREGLFVPEDLTGVGPWLLPEGASDTAALLDLGFDAVGRPSCYGGVKHVVDVVGRLRPESTVIMADADHPGQRGAASLASVLRAYVPAVKVITPPGEKDIRDWRRSGAKRDDVLALIDETPALELRLTVQHGGRRR